MRYFVSSLVGLAFVLTLGTSAFANHVSTVSLCSDVVPLVLFATTDSSDQPDETDDSPTTLADTT